MATINNIASRNQLSLRVFYILGLLLISQLSLAWHSHEADSPYLHQCKICSQYQHDSNIAQISHAVQTPAVDELMSLQQILPFRLNRASKPPARASPA